MCLRGWSWFRGELFWNGGFSNFRTETCLSAIPNKTNAYQRPIYPLHALIASGAGRSPLTVKRMRKMPSLGRGC
jgi:hypothetical protein